MRNLRAALAAALALAFPAAATVTGNPPPAVYSCNGTTTTYTIPFPYLATSNIVATVTTGGIAVPLALTTDFTVSPAIAPSTGTLKLVAGSRCPNGSTLTVSRFVPLTQPQSFRTGPYSGAAHEQAFDRILMQLQQVDASRIALATKEAADFATALNPTPAAVNGAASVIATGGNTGLTLANWFATTAVVATYGAPGAGLVDETAAIQSAIDLNKGKTIILPPGTYLVTSLSLVGTTYNRTRIIGQNATITCNSATATECINLDGVTGTEIGGDLVIRPTGASYVDTIKVAGGNQNRITSGVRIGFFDGDAPAPFTSDVAWGYYGGNAVNGVHFIGKTSGTNALSFYNTITGLRVKSIGGFAVVIEAASPSAVSNNNIVRGLNVLSRNGVKILGGIGNEIDGEDLECTDTGIYLDSVSTAAATDNRIRVQWMEYARTPIFWGTATTGSKGNAVEIAHAATMYALPYYVVPRPGGTNNSLRMSAAGISDFKMKSSATATGSPVRMEAVWTGDDALTYGADLFTDGNAEANSGVWTSVGTVTQTQSNEQAHGGTFSRKVVTGAVAGQNGVQQTITTTVGTVYRLSFWIYLLSSQFATTTDYNGMNAFAGSDTVGFRRSGTGTWFNVVLFTRATSTSTVFKWIDQASTALTWYLDDVSVQAVTGGATGHLAEWGEKFGINPRTISGSIGLDGSVATPALVLTTTTFANLGALGGTANGTIAYCSDCTIASPCAGGGTGALAKRLAGAWVCN